MTDEELPPMMKLLQINKAIEQEMAGWDRDKLDFRAFGVHTINLDNQLWALVDYLKQLIPEFDEVEYEYRWKSRFLGKVSELRMDVKKQQTVQSITQGIIGPNGAPIDVDKHE
jgi:hypothetical protein